MQIPSLWTAILIHVCKSQNCPFERGGEGSEGRNIVLISVSQMIHLDSTNDTFTHLKQYVYEFLII